MLAHLLAFISVVVVSQYLQIAAQELHSNPQIYFGGEGHQGYLDWAESGDAISRYDRSVFLPTLSDPVNGVAVHWRVTGPDDSNIHSEGTIHLAVSAKAKGWVAFGITENGGMFGADIVAWEAAKANQLRDLYTRDQFAVYDDGCNHWKLVSSHVKGDFIIFEATRALNTGDTQDRAILYDHDEIVIATRVVAAWGDGPAVEYHGKSVARGSIRWFGNELEDNRGVSSTSDSGSSSMTSFGERMKDVSVGYFDILAGNHTIEAIETAYVTFCLTRSQALAAAGLPNDTESFTIVGMEAIIEQKNADYVHHFTVMSSQETNDDPGFNCTEGRFMTTLYVWAPGEEPFALPENVGLNFSPDSMQSFALQTHYNNPSLEKGVVDNSGIRFYFSMVQREHEMGVYQFGDVLLRLGNSTVGEILSEHTFDCPFGCSTMALGTEKVTVMREYLHMHTTGIRAALEHSRDGEKIRERSVDYFDYNQGSQSIPQHQFEIHPGDSFSISCYYNAKNDTIFGTATANEMCIAFMFYYPRQEISVANGRLDIPWMCTYGIEQFGDCKTGYQSRKLASEDELNRIFGSPSDQCANDESPVSPPSSEKDSPPENTDSDSGAFGRSAKFLFALMSFMLLFNL